MSERNMAELIERLRANRVSSVFGGGSVSADGNHTMYQECIATLINPDGPEAADLIATMQAREAELVGALEAARKVIEQFRDPDCLGEGVHTGLRKGTDEPGALKIWEAIASTNSSAWREAVEFAIDPYFSMWGGDEVLAQIERLSPATAIRGASDERG